MEEVVGCWRTVTTFWGFEPNVLIRLSDGNWWLQVGGPRWSHVDIRPEMELRRVFDGYTLNVVGQSIRARVRRVQPVVVQQIDGMFRGWYGATAYRLGSGEVWQQTDGAGVVRFVLRPAALVYRLESQYWMEVANTRVSVRRVAWLNGVEARRNRAGGMAAAGPTP